MTKIYLVWDRYTDDYFNIVAGKIRCCHRYNAYAYDRKHASLVLQRVKKSYHYFNRPIHSLCLKEIPIMRVDLTESFYKMATAKLFMSRKLSFYDGLRQLKYEQVRRYNDYITYNPRSESHSRRLALGTI